MRKSSFFFIYVVLCILINIAFLGHAAYERTHRAAGLEEQASLVRSLELTDLCLFTEARYTRHPSQADLHSSFQDHPCSLEHFPSGSLLMPQRGNAENRINVD
jgi:hypothetical protein